jgi:hypothetical protein
MKIITLDQVYQRYHRKIIKHSVSEYLTFIEFVDLLRVNNYWIQ